MQQKIPKPPTEVALAAFLKEYCGVTATVKKRLEDGLRTHVHAPTKARKVESDLFNPGESKYERAALERSLYGSTCRGQWLFKMT